MPAASDLTGLKFGRLRVEKRHARFRRTRKSEPETYYTCLCECGKRKKIRGASLSFGATKSCGCQMGGGPRPDRRLKEGESNFNVVLRRYVSDAKKRGVKFRLSVQHAKRLMGDFCFYCGSPPLSLMDKPGSFGAFVYNGIDRIDSSRGYVRSNVVTCCANCNWVKGRCSFGRFIAWIKAVHRNIEKKLKSWPKRLRDSVLEAERDPLRSGLGLHPKLR